MGKSSYITADKINEVGIVKLFSLSHFLIHFDTALSELKDIWVFYLIGRLTKDQEVNDIWSVWDLLYTYINVFFGKFETFSERILFVWDFKLPLE